MREAAFTPFTIGRYHCEKLLSAGGTGDLYLATHLPSGARRTLRLLPQQILEDAETAELLLGVLLRVQQLAHPNILAVHEILHKAGRLYVVLDHHRGPTVRHLLAKLREVGPLSLTVASNVVWQICQALELVHHLEAQGQPAPLVHGALWPHNVLVSESGEVRLTGFGSWLIPRPVLVEANVSVRTQFSYLSPEHLSGEPLCRASDIFCVGILLYEMITARPLFLRPSLMETVQRVEHAELSDLDEVPEPVQEVVRRCLARDPRDRFPDAASLVGELTSVVRGARDRSAQKGLAAFLNLHLSTDEAEASPRPAPLPGQEDDEATYVGPADLTEVLRSLSRERTNPGMDPWRPGPAPRAAAALDTTFLPPPAPLADAPLPEAEEDPTTIDPPPGTGGGWSARRASPEGRPDPTGPALFPPEEAWEAASPDQGAELALSEEVTDPGLLPLAAPAGDAAADGASPPGDFPEEPTQNGPTLVKLQSVAKLPAGAPALPPGEAPTPPPGLRPALTPTDPRRLLPKAERLTTLELESEQEPTRRALSLDALEAAAEPNADRRAQSLAALQAALDLGPDRREEPPAGIVEDIPTVNEKPHPEAPRLLPEILDPRRHAPGADESSAAPLFASADNSDFNSGVSTAGSYDRSYDSEISEEDPLLPDGPAARLKRHRGKRRFTAAHGLLLVAILFFLFSIFLLVRRLISQPSSSAAPVVASKRARESSVGPAHDLRPAPDRSRGRSDASDRSRDRGDTSNLRTTGQHLQDLHQGKRRPGQLRVLSTPPGTVYLDGRELGPTPQQVRLKPGEKATVVVAARGHALHREVAVGQREGALVQAHLKPATYPRAERPPRGVLLIRCTRNDHRHISIDGVDTGYACPKVAFLLRPAKYRLGFYAIKGDRTSSIRVRVQANKRTVLYLPRR